MTGKKGYLFPGTLEQLPFIREENLPVPCMNGHLPYRRFFLKILRKRRVVELGAGMMPYGYALAATCGAKNFVAVEPFYADKQRASVKAIIEEQGSLLQRIPYKVEGRDMLDYLKDEADELLCVVACSIEVVFYRALNTVNRWRGKSIGF